MILQELDFKDLKINNKSLEKLKLLSLPNKKMEDFRHINTKELFSNNLVFSNDIDDKENLYKDFLNNDFYSLVIKNSKIDLSLSNLPKDIQISSNDIDENIDFINTLFLLNETLSLKNNILSINKEINKPLIIINTYSNKNGFFTNNLHINIKENIKVDILDVFITQKEDNLFANINRIFNIQKNTKLTYTKLNLFSKTDTLIINNKINIYGGDVSLYAIDNSSKQSINQYDISLENEKSNINMYSIIKINKEQKIANTIKIAHNDKNTYSNQVFKQVLDNNARAIFNSQITIHKGSIHSSAHQNSQTILIDDNARVFNEPRMMIFTDELEASHGATVGSLNADAINYMKLRGLSQKQSEKILIEAFSNEIYESISNSIIKEYIKNLSL
jgi:Fe-S cluster assembly protein SufD